MHQAIVVKVWADDEDDARPVATDVLETSCESGNECGWDYVGSEGAILLTVAPNPFKTLQEMEEALLKDRVTQMTALQLKVKEALMVELAPTFLTKEQATLLVSRELAVGIDDDTFKEIVEQTLKAKRDRKVPKTFEEIVEGFSKKLCDLARQQDHLMYTLKRIKRLQRCIDDPLMLDYTLQCTDNSFAEIPRDVSDGKKAYYFQADRHL